MIELAVGRDDRRVQPKERVVLLERGDDVVAVPFTLLQRRHVIRVTVGGHRFVVRWRGAVASALDSGSISIGRDVGSAGVTDQGKPVAFDEPFWFAVVAFRPHTRIVH